MEQTLKCLLIDDDADDRLIFELAAGRAIPSMHCMTEEDSVQAMAMLVGDAAFTPHAIFLDLNMPGLDGKECLRRIREVDRLARTPVYILSTSNNRKDVQDARELGSSGYLVKPNSLDALVQALLGAIRSMGSGDFYLYGKISP